VLVKEKEKAKLNCWTSSFARKATSSADFEMWLKVLLLRSFQMFHQK